MILVSGAAGKSGQAVIKTLAERGQAVRALVRRPEQEAAVREAGAQSVVAGDMRDERSVLVASRGARAIYHIAPNMSSDEVLMGRVALDAARQTGLQHFVYHSVLHPQTSDMPHHWDKLRVEEMILKSGLPFTILQPAAYMQNIRGSWNEISSKGTYPVPYPTTTRLSLVDLRDVAEIACRVLTEAGHEGAIYELSGTRPISPEEIASVLSRLLSKSVRAEEVPLQTWRRRAESAGTPPAVVERLLQMFRYYAAHGFVGNPRVLTALLGREPAPLEAFIRRLL